MKTETFSAGDQITLNTGFACDQGVVIRDDGEAVIWKDKDGDRYTSPKSKYRITKTLKP